jgi:hypothetical protein
MALPGAGILIINSNIESAPNRKVRGAFLISGQ